MSAPQGLPEQDARIIGELFAGASRPVELAVFRPAAQRQAGEDFLARLRQVQALVPLLRVSVRDYAPTETLVERAPAVALLGSDGTDLRVRFYGWPSGFELGSVVTAAADAARGGSALQPQTLEALAGLRADVQVKVFSTPT